MWYMDFEERQNFAIGNQNLYSHKDLFFSNYEIAAKFNDSYSRVFRKQNVMITDESLEIAITVDGLEPFVNNENQRIICGGIGTTRQDFLYGSFRSNMRTTNVEGTVTGMFVYHPEGEIDIEIVSAVKPSQAYFATHPGITENGKASSLTHGNYIFDFDPSQDYHEYRFDWYPDLTVFYIDSIEQYRITTNVLAQPSRVMFNHWTDGNQNFSQGPAKENAYLNIKNMTFFFNSSDTLLSTPKCINVNTTCNIESI
ncbi:concanavalin A-like lectin/glucanase domain-containing protein [Thamnidium elegans]|nr:concanavalin A-like lectin/glucanase domain-containing protein [Thamnidium elegans]